MNHHLLLVTELMGKKVKLEDGQEIGVVQNIMINPEERMIEYIILCFADFIGKTHRHFVISNEIMALRKDGENKVFFEIERKRLSTISSLNIEDPSSSNDMKQRVYEIDQDAPQFLYQNFL